MKQFLFALFVCIAFAMPAVAQDSKDVKSRGDFTQEEMVEIRAIFADLSKAKDAISDAEKRLLDLILAHPVAPPVKPPVDPPVDPPVKPPVDPPSGLRPGEDLDWAIRLQPDASEHDWIIENNLAVSTRGLASLAAGPGVGLGNAYRASRAVGDRDIVFAIVDNAGEAWIGGQYNRPGQPSSKDLVWAGESAASATFIGISDHASVSLVFSSSSSRAQPTGDVLCFNIGVRGPSDSFVVRASSRSEHVQFDGCWWLAKIGKTGFYKTGIHIDEYGTLVIKDHQWRGETPGSPGLKFAEHPIAYLKSGRISTIIQGCNMYGGNRTGFQRRPQPFFQGQPHDLLPSDPIMVRNNYCENYGDNWEHGDGGAVYTVWVSPVATYIYDNSAHNFRFKALVISGQPDYRDDPSKMTRNFDFLASGNQHRNIYVSGNEFIPGPLTERGTVGISATDYVRLYDDNHFEGRVTLDGSTNNRYNGLRNVTEEIWTHTGPPDWDLWTLDDVTEEERRMTEQEVRDLLVRY